MSPTVIRKNVKRLIKEGMEKDEAFDYAYRFARQNSKRRLEAIHTRPQKEQRKR
jgi:hypothetical protein